MTGYNRTREGSGRRESDCADTCTAHSGTVTGIKGLYALLVLLISLLGSQMMFQIPAIKLDILAEVKGITARIVELEKKDIEIKAQMDDFRSRLGTVERLATK